MVRLRRRAAPSAAEASAAGYGRFIALVLLPLLLLVAGATLANGGGGELPRLPTGTNGRPRHPAALSGSNRRPAAWGETWEFEEDVLEPLQRLGTRILDFVLRRQPPEEPHPLRMQRWTIYIRKLPFRRVVRHMQFYADGTCEVEEEIGGDRDRALRRMQRQQQQQQQQQQQKLSAPTTSPNGKKRRRRKKKSAAGGSNSGGSDAAAGASQQQQQGQQSSSLPPPPPPVKGKWKYDKYGLNWELEENGIRHFYHAELIWHSFGDRPKMHCGVIVRNRGPRSLLPPWLFRPVVGTFHGLGNGTDTYLQSAEGADNRFANY